MSPHFMVLFKQFKNKSFKYKGANNLDKKIESYLNYNNGYFVELGANDGITQSNSYYFEKYRGWRGTLLNRHHTII